VWSPKEGRLHIQNDARLEALKDTPVASASLRSDVNTAIIVEADSQYDGTKLGKN